MYKKLTEYALKGNKNLHYLHCFHLYLLLPFALMQKVAPKNQGCIHPWLKIKVSVGRKPERCAQTVVPDFIDRANDFMNAGFIRPFGAICAVRIAYLFSSQR
jgi:hypothetical protein